VLNCFHAGQDRAYLAAGDVLAGVVPGGAQGSKHAFRIRGEAGNGFQYPFAGAALSLAVAIWFVRIRLGWEYGAGMAWVLGGLNFVLLIALVYWLDRGRLVSGSVQEEAA